jgi:5-methylcytosine-specific restriction endonuclease McrA
MSDASLSEDDFIHVFGYPDPGPGRVPPVAPAAREAAMARAGHRCEDCSSREQLTLHHLHYRSVGHERPEDLAVLCWPCHQERHRDRNGEYWRDPEDMEDAWFQLTE